jgi:hypothetical protein
MLDIANIASAALNSLTEAKFHDLRSPLIGAYVSLGGLMLTSFSIVSSRLHEFMKTDEAEERRVTLEAIRPNAPHTQALEARANEVVRAVKLCFLTAGLSMTISLVDSAIFRWVCLITALVTLTYVGHVGLNSIKAYFAWLRLYQRQLSEKARRRAS